MNIIENDRERYRKIFGERDKQKDHWVYSTCSGCYAGCAIRVRVLDGKPVAVEGVPESDHGAQGGLCAKGVAAIMDWNNPNRILYPVKRTNPNKGINEDPKWERISWEDALDRITEKLVAIRKKDPRSVVYGYTPSPNGGMKTGIFMHFFAAYGTTSKASGGPGIMCGANAHHVGALHYAAWDIIPDYRYCNYVLRCGGNEGWGGGRNASASIRLASAARERGMKMKVMDPQGFTVASKGEEWIPILPATDIAVFLAIANLIINEIGVYDREYIRHKTNGSYLIGPDRLYVRDEQTNKPLLFDQADGTVKTYDDPSLTQPAIEGKYTASGVECQPIFALIKEHVKQYKPDWASEISTVPADTIKRLARELVDEARIGSFIDINGLKVPYRPACVVGYKGVQTHSNSFHQYCAMHLINTLLGNQDVCGGLLGSGTARSLGYPETGGFTFAPYGGLDGMLTVGAWPSGHVGAWPPRKIAGPGTMMDFSDVLTHTSCGSIYPYSEDWEELWRNAGQPFMPEAFFTYGANVVMSSTRPETVEKFLRRIPFIVGFQPFHNETTEGFCDIVLPECHYLETLDIGGSFGTTFNYPIGMDKWSFHVRMPVTEPRGEARVVQDVMNDLADRLGIRDGYNDRLDAYYTFRKARQAGKDIEIPRIIEPGDKPSNAELVDRTLKYHFGKESGLEWFRENGFITWNKRPEECYWRWFVNARVPIYYEEVEADRNEVRERAEKAGFHLNWDYFTGMTSYFPSVIFTEFPPDTAYDLLLLSQRDPLMTQRFTAANPYINTAALLNPYTYNIAMNAETAKKKGINEGDTICLENRWGDKVTGNVRLTQLIHPMVAAAVGLGSWARAKTFAQGKGINPNAVLRYDQYHFCPVSGAAEPTARVKAYKK